MPLGSLLVFPVCTCLSVFQKHTQPLTCTTGAAGRHHLTCVSCTSRSRCFKPHSGVRVRLWPSSDPCELGSSAASSSPEIYGGVRHHTKRARPHRDFTQPTELHLIDRSGSGHSVPGHSQCSACEWKRKSHVCEGMH